MCPWVHRVGIKRDGGSGYGPTCHRAASNMTKLNPGPTPRRTRPRPPAGLLIILIDPLPAVAWIKGVMHPSSKRGTLTPEAGAGFALTVGGHRWQSGQK